MAKRAKEAQERYDAMWADGRGSHHPDYDPEAAVLEDFAKASRETEEMYNAIVANDVVKVRVLRACLPGAPVTECSSLLSPRVNAPNPAFFVFASPGSV